MLSNGQVNFTQSNHGHKFEGRFIFLRHELLLSRLPAKRNSRTTDISSISVYWDALEGNKSSVDLNQPGPNRARFLPHLAFKGSLDWTSGQTLDRSILCCFHFGNKDWLLIREAPIIYVNLAKRTSNFLAPKNVLRGVFLRTCVFHLRKLRIQCRSTSDRISCSRSSSLTAVTHDTQFYGDPNETERRIARSHETHAALWRGAPLWTRQLRRSAPRHQRYMCRLLSFLQ